MPIARLHISLEIDGRSVPGFPRNVVLSVDEYQPFDYDEAADGDDTTFSALPGNQVTTGQLIALDAQEAVGVRVEGENAANNTAMRLGNGGGYVAWGASVTATNLTVNRNDASAVARLRGVVAGS